MRYSLFRTVTFLLALSALTSCVKSEVSSVPEDALVVDVRTPKEFESWHYPGAINVPFNEIESRVDEFGAKDSLIIVYCLSGHRSVTAKNKLIELGFTNVLNGGTKRHMKKLVPEDD